MKLIEGVSLKNDVGLFTSELSYHTKELETDVPVCTATNWVTVTLKRGLFGRT